MDVDKEKYYADFPVFKGLQKPLDFMGFQGRYIFWAAGTAGGTTLGFIIVFQMYCRIIVLLISEDYCYSTCNLYKKNFYFVVSCLIMADFKQV